MFAPSPKGFSPVLIWVLSVPLVVAVSLLTAFAPKQAVALVLGAVFVSVAFIVPQSWLIVWTLIFAALIGGSIEYFLGIGQANWIPFILSLVLAARAILGSNSPRLVGQPRVRRPTALFAVPAWIFLAILVGSAVANAAPILQVLAAAKNYLLMWGVLIAFALLPDLKRATSLVWKWILVIAAFQLPVAMYQKFFIASKLSNTSGSLSFDAINGTFGGGLLGGRSGALAMFICIALAYALIQWRDKKWKTYQLIAYLMVTLPTLAIVEVKATVFWLPAVVLLVFFSLINRRPLTFVVTLIVSLLAALGILYIYQQSYGGTTGGDSLVAAFLQQIYYVFDPDRFNPITRELGRMSVLTHWWRENSIDDPLHFLLGYGPGASRGVSTIAVGSVAANYNFLIDISAAAALLWDAGLLGLLTFLTMLLLGAMQIKVMARKLGNDESLRVNLEAAFIALLLILSSVFYVRDAVDGPIIQFIMFFCLGHAIFGQGKRQNAQHKRLIARP